MIQRIQSVYLLVVALLAGIGPFVADLWLDSQGEEFFAENELWISIALYASAALALLAIFLFKNRKPKRQEKPVNTRLAPYKYNLV